MTDQQVNALVQFIGIVSQLGGALLLIALFAVLRANTLRRDYFRIWGHAWLALMITSRNCRTVTTA